MASMSTTRVRTWARQLFIYETCHPTPRQEDKGFSDMTIISGLLLVPLALGGLGICILDVMYTRQPHLAHQHYE